MEQSSWRFANGDVFMPRKYLWSTEMVLFLDILSIGVETIDEIYRISFDNGMFSGMFFAFVCAVYFLYVAKLLVLHFLFLGYMPYMQ